MIPYVMTLGALCDFDTLSPQAGADELDLRDSPGVGVQHFLVREFAAMSDGRTLFLLEDRGWSQQVPVESSAQASLNLPALRRETLNVVLPDDAELTGEQHRWDALTAALLTQGVTVDAQHLRTLPYTVIISERLANVAEVQ